VLKHLNHPVDTKSVLRFRNALRRELMKEGGARTKIRIAILGGSTTSEVRNLFELYLLKEGFEPEFYECSYGRYKEEVLLENPELSAFKPEIIYFHITSKDIRGWPSLGAGQRELEAWIQERMEEFRTLWTSASERYGAVLIQNNFDLPTDRPLGNLDGFLPGGRGALVVRLNVEMARLASARRGVIIHDIFYLSSRIGLDQWFDATRWCSYKLAVSLEATVELGKSLASLVKGIYGGARKCLVLDLDNTLWGGTIGDDGLDSIQLGADTPMGLAYLDFQKYVHGLRERGILLAACSKNDARTAETGLTHPDNLLQREHFSAFYANWEPKPDNLKRIAKDLNIGLESLVFLDDNPAEREIVRAQLPMVAVPEVTLDPLSFIVALERERYFETPAISEEDLQRGSLYQQNQIRASEGAKFASYDDYLKSLMMSAEIGPFQSVFLDRITQLTNKTNQFNLTTRRYTLPEIKKIGESPDCVTLYGRLRDKFGDNGLVSVIIGRQEQEILHIELWLMSCRVLKRDMELAMFDALIQRCQERGVSRLIGRYLKTAKNELVMNHYSQLGFVRVSPESSLEDSLWEFQIPLSYECKNRHISLDYGSNTKPASNNI
jgi:FkbH-like protein